MTDQHRIAVSIAELAKDPKKLALAVKVLSDPQGSIDALNSAISTETDPDRLRWMQSMRDKVERYAADLRGQRK